MHLRVLSERLEYLYGVIPTTPIADNTTAQLLADFIRRENSRRDLSGAEKCRAVEIFRDYLEAQIHKKQQSPFFDPAESGALYVMARINYTINQFRNRAPIPSEKNLLDTES